MTVVIKCMRLPVTVAINYVGLPVTVVINCGRLPVTVFINCYHQLCETVTVVINLGDDCGH